MANETWWYRGYKIGDRPTRWMKRRGYRAILVSKPVGKTHAFTPTREWCYREGDEEAKVLVIEKAKRFIDTLRG